MPESRNRTSAALTLPPASLGSSPPVDPAREADLDRAKEQFLERLRTKDIGDDARQRRQRREEQEREDDARREQVAARSRAPNVTRDPALRRLPAQRTARPAMRPIAAPLLPAANVDPGPPAPDHPLNDLLAPRRSSPLSTLVTPFGESAPAPIPPPFPVSPLSLSPIVDPSRSVDKADGLAADPSEAVGTEAYSLQEIATVSATDAVKPLAKPVRLNSQVPLEIARRIEEFGRTGVLDTSPLRFTAPDILVDADSPLPEAPAGWFPTGPFMSPPPEPRNFAMAESLRKAALSARWASASEIGRQVALRGSSLRVIQGGGGSTRDPFGGTRST